MTEKTDLPNEMGETIAIRPEMGVLLTDVCRALGDYESLGWEDAAGLGL